MNVTVGIFWLLLLVGSPVLIFLLKRKGWLIITIFTGWQLMFGVIGWLSAFYLAGDVYVLNGDEGILYRIAPLVIGMFLISLLLAIISPRANQQGWKNESFHTVVVRHQRSILILQYIAVAFCIVLILSVDVSSAPLFNWWASGPDELHQARISLYKNSWLMSQLGVVRYLFQYAIFPMLAFAKGIGHRVRSLSLALFIFVGVLTLAKTAFVLIVLGYVFGRSVKDGSVKPLVYGMAYIVVGFMFIVFATYYLDGSRTILDVLYVFYLRLFVIPISIAAEYANIYSFEDGMRSSTWYVTFFGGSFERLDLLACQMNQGRDCTMVSGIYGSLFPNVPRFLHWPYIVILCMYVWLVSVFTGSISRPMLRLSATFILGLASAFFFLTDPLVALNTYGFLWGSVGVFLYFLFKSLKRVR